MKIARQPWMPWQPMPKPMTWATERLEQLHRASGCQCPISGADAGGSALAACGEGRVSSRVDKRHVPMDRSDDQVSDEFAASCGNMVGCEIPAFGNTLNIPNAVLSASSVNPMTKVLNLKIGALSLKRSFTYPWVPADPADAQAVSVFAASPGVEECAEPACHFHPGWPSDVPLSHTASRSPQ